MQNMISFHDKMHANILFVKLGEICCDKLPSVQEWKLKSEPVIILMSEISRLVIPDSQDLYNSFNTVYFHGLITEQIIFKFMKKKIERKTQLNS